VKKRRLRYIFRGRVQGVGFRWRARHAADHFGLTGYVRNEYDGSVTAEVQGRIEDIYGWLKLLNSDLYIEIDNMESKELEIIEDERGFRVAY